MCIIVAKPKGVSMPPLETLKTCFISNPDGAGLMYVKDNQVIIDKGYMNIDDLLVRIEKLKNELHSDLTDNAIVFHFRIGTAGKNDKETTHPFIITNQDDKLRATKITSNLGVVHNGVIYHYSYKGGILSDTQLFIKNVIYPISKLNKNFYKDEGILTMFEDLTNSKLCFLDNHENIFWCGDKIEDNGIIYSNTSYKKFPMTAWTQTKLTDKTNTDNDDVFNDNYSYDDYPYGFDGYYLNDVRDELMIVCYGDYISYDGGRTFAKNTTIKYVDEYGYLYRVDDEGFLVYLSDNATIYDREYDEVAFNYGT